MADEKDEKDDKKDEKNEHPKDPNRPLLIAHVRAHLVNGETFELLPIKHEEDVKSEVTALMDSWAKSGFLLRGRHIYPWHQVSMLEVLEVEQLPMREAQLRLEDLYAADRARVQESFWKTQKKADGKGKDGGDEKGDDKGDDEGKDKSK